MLSVDDLKAMGILSVGHRVELLVDSLLACNIM